MKATVVIFSGLLLGGAVIAQAQQPSAPQASATSYTWHAELVSSDQNTITVKARVVAPGAVSELKNFKAGDRALVHWSGFETTADGVRGIMKYDAARTSKEAFLLPVELVTPAVQNDYVSLKLRVPASASAALTAVKPGEWVTITTRHRPASDAEAVVSIRAYASTGEKGTN